MNDLALWNFPAALLGYLIGSLPLGSILIRRLSGRDPASFAAYNMGVENVMRFVGPRIAVAALLVDMLKGVAAIALAGGHPASIGAAFLASPITPLHPALASGTVSAAVELWLRKPTVRDFAALRTDLDNWRGWWRNGVARILLNFFLTSLGTGIGVWLTGVRVFQALIRT